MKNKVSIFVLVLMVLLFGIIFTDYIIPITNTYQAATKEYSFIERIFRGKTTYGMVYHDAEYGDLTVIPTEYSKLEFVGSLLVGYKEDSDNIYLFTRKGEPLFDYYDIKSYKYYNNSRNNTYYGRIFSSGVYITVDTDQGKGIIFIQEAANLQWIEALSYGPYADIVPGCFGYMYKSRDTQKWGYQVCYYRLVSGNEPAELQEEYNLLKPQYDEIIEHYNATDLQNKIIFARQGEQWLAFNREGKQINYPQKLLNIILYLDPLPKLSKDPKYTSARIGTEEASVAFVGY